MSGAAILENDARKAKVLFVDDEPFVLDAIRRTIRTTFNASFAEGGQAALDILRSGEVDFSVVCTDMRMPSVDGLRVLSSFRELAPDTTRMLLTGQADLETAAAAVNEGNVFRFLLKPTNPDQLKSAITDALEFRRLKIAERELLELTLRGSVQALMETLSLANPVAFARASRIRGLVTQLLQHLDVDDKWQIEVAAMLSQIGAVTLPPEVSDHLNRGVPLSRDELRMVSELPGMIDRLLSGIPRLEEARHIIVSQGHWEHSGAPMATKLLVLASELDTLSQRKLDRDVIVSMLKERSQEYGPTVMGAFDALKEIVVADQSMLLLTPEDLMTGMLLAGDVRTIEGVLLAGGGQEVTETLLARIVNFARSAGLEEDTVAVFERVE